MTGFRIRKKFSAASPALALITAASLWLSGCFNSDGFPPEYTLYKGDELMSAQGAIAPDGTPVLLGLLGMRYGFDGPPPDGVTNTTVPNYPSVVLERADGKWSAHPLRNVHHEFYSSQNSGLLADAAGKLHAWAADGDKIRLYHKSGGDWVRGSWLPSPANYGYSGLFTLHPGGGIFGITGEDTLWSISSDWNGGQLKVQASNGQSLVLDTASEFAALACLSGKGFGAAVGVKWSHSSERSWQDLSYYFWRSDLTHGDYAKRVLMRDVQGVDCHFTHAFGKHALIVKTPDSLMIYSLDDAGSISRSQARELPGVEAGSFRYTQFTAVTEDGCLHSLAQNFSDTSFFVFTHDNLCDLSREDTLRIPIPHAERQYQTPQVQLLAGPGKSLAALVSFRQLPTGPEEYGEKMSAWLYLAEKKDSGWSVEKAAEY